MESFWSPVKADPVLPSPALVPMQDFLDAAPGAGQVARVMFQGLHMFNTSRSGAPHGAQPLPNQERKTLKLLKGEAGNAGMPAMAKTPAPAKIGTADTADSYLHYRFGGLKGLRRHGHFKEVRVADPFQQTILHFPHPLAAENWLVSCFGRSLICTVPTEPMLALDRGRVIKARGALVLESSDAPVADFIAKQLDEETGEKWQRFQRIALAHGYRPELRTPQEIRGDVMRLRNLERMRQQLIQYIGDERSHRATTTVERFMGAHRNTTISELCEAIAHDLLPEGAVECAAISLYRLGAIDMNISEASYGAQTTLQLL